MCGDRIFHRFARAEQGSAAVELAIVLPALAMILVGLAQFAWLQHCASSLRYALSTSARALLVNPGMTQAELQAMVKAKLADADPNVGVTLSINPGANGKVATVDGVYDKTISVPLLPDIPVHYHTQVKASLPAF